MGNPLVKPSSMSLFGNATNPNSNPGGPLFGMKQPSTASSNSSDGRLFGLGNNTMSTRSVANELFSAKRMSIIDLTGDGPTQLSDNTAMSGDDAGLVLSHENRSPPVDVLGGRALSAGMSSTKGTAGGTIFASVPRNIVASNAVPFYGNPGQPLSFVGSNGPTHFAGQQQQQQPFGGFPHSPHFANQQQQPYSVCWQPVFQVTAPFVNQLQQQLFQGLQAPADFSHLHYQQQQYAGWHPGMYLANQQQLQQQPFNGPIYFTHQSQQQQLFGGFQPVAHLDGQHQNQQQTSDDANKQPVATKASQSTQRRLG
ncbi:uncharacterized protein RCC_02261 [Ramularia collo-cygni]|uniref:Uncharacterized protein n=1 Tax=Ramularia collo-cygni TaxID=112498 RepID=A0A2D3UQC3_9PEZI|nr:uncharacterized protein RCC_02261 [Ramularia collo-cygni]CZT16418.1 uncharacterized protein RCC_02261 [Ramularia collo-cygni]